jgi:Bifunctional DNA primase/polymerase, N-terminal/Primase C terminal 2 (PriCT-2)/Family of unknown function (DUF5906)
VFSEYVQHGWAICIIDRGQKGPLYDDWNERPIDAETAEGIVGAGLLHVQSGTCALDIDNIDLARPWLAERGVDLDALLAAKDAVRISSGRPRRAKLLYRLKSPLRTIKPKGSGVELRCATAAGKSMQDVLPPTVHPDTRKPYEWQYGEPLLGDWGILPAIPAALKAAWRELLADEPDAPPPRALNGHMDVALEKLHQWIESQDPNAEYDDWLKVGAKLHHATGGAEEGLEIWQSWSKKATRRQHNKDVHVAANANWRAHWLSFSSVKGKHLATLDNELPAEADEFEVIPDEPAAKGPAPVEEKVREAARKQRQDAIAKLEAKVVYVVNSEKYFDVERHKLIGSEAALEHLFTSSMPWKSGARMNPVKVLKNSNTKRLVEALAFHPGDGAIFTVGDDSYANLYRNRLPKPIEPTEEERRKIDWCFDRIEDPSYIKWLKQYYAHIVQHPGIKLKSAPLLWSETQRNGKSTLVKTIPALLVGAEYSHDVSPDLLQSPFNDYLEGAWHVNLLEFRVGSRGERAMITNKLKAYITDDMVPLHPKGGKGYTMPNHFFVTASGNDEDAAAIDNNDERWGVHEFKQPKFTDAERKWIYYDFLLLPRAAAVLRHYFLHVDLDGFYPAGSAPMTEDKQEMAAASLASDVELLQLMFEERAEFFARDVVITSEVLSYVHKHSTMRPSATRIGKVLCRAPFNGTAIQFRVGEKRYRGVIIRNHHKWTGLPGRKLMDHIGGDDDIEVDLMA